VRVFVAFVLAGSIGCAADDELESTPSPNVQHCSDPLALMLPDGRCVRPGIPPDGCASGFAHDGEYGCNAVLPTEMCPPGLMAVPGEATCRPVMDCGAGRWGDIPVDATTEYVDAAFAGGASDGSEARPWTTIGEAVASAAAGTLVAIAAGSYVEDVVISGKPLRLHGVCPDKVTIVATGQPTSCPAAALCVASGAHRTEVRGIALSGNGIRLSGALDVVFDRIRVHDIADEGIAAGVTLGETSFTLRDSLVERAHELGIFVSGSEAHVEGSVVRETLPALVDQDEGRGMSVQVPCFDTNRGQVCEPTRRASATITRSLIEHNYDTGLRIAGSDVTLEASVVRATVPSDDTGGRGIDITIPCAGQSTGFVCYTEARSSANVVRSIVEQNHDLGVQFAGSDGLLDASVVRNTSPPGGRGVNIQDQCPMMAGGPCSRGTAIIRASLIEANHEAGVVALTGDVRVESSVVRRNLRRPSDNTLGRGIDVERLATATVIETLIDHNNDAGVFVRDARARIEASVVRATSSISGGLFGDGVTVVNADAELLRTRVQDSARAGIATFGGMAALGSTRIECAAFSLTGQGYGGGDFAFEDRGDNLCGCPNADAMCKLVNAELAPPPAVDDGE
jgi:hypothetical protein